MHDSPIPVEGVKPRVTVAIPVKDPGHDLMVLLDALAAQTLAPDFIVIADSSSDPSTVAQLVQGRRVMVIAVEPSAFDHGGTRNLLARSTACDVVVFLTQDALPADKHAIETLVNELLADDRNGVAFGRQLPHPGMGPFAHHARAFTYPPTPYTWRPGYDRDTSRRLFCSDAFAAWRTSALDSIGGLPEGVISWEDTLGAARLLETGWNVHYAADAAVIHSHDYSLRDEFRRYFDMGAVHATQQWFAQSYERAEREGMKFVRSELGYCRANGMRDALPQVIARNGARWIGYQAGKRFRFVPPSLRRRWSQNKAYWDRIKRTALVVFLLLIPAAFNTSRAAAQSVKMPSGPSAMLPADDWSLRAARRLQALGLTPPGYDRGTSTPETAWMFAVLSSANANAANGEYRDLADSYLRRFTYEHRVVGDRMAYINGAVAAGFIAHADAVLPGRTLGSGAWSGVIAIDDTTDATLRVQLGVQPASWLSGSVDAAAFTSGVLVREATGEVGAGGLGVWAGQRAAGYATARSGGVTWNGGVPFDGLGVHTLHPFTLPSILRLIGPLTFETMLARTDSEAPVPHPWFWTARVTAQPVKWAGATITRAAFAGTTDGSSVRKRDLVNLFIGRNAFSLQSPNYIDNQIVSMDGWFRMFFLKPSPMFYFDWGAEDSHGAWWHVPGHSFGLLFPVLPGAEHFSGGIERTLFAHSKNGNPAWYRHGQFTNGWTKDGYLLGHPLGGQGTQTLVYVDGDLPSQDTQIGASFARGVRGEQNVYAPERMGSFHSMTLRASRRVTGAWSANASAEYSSGSAWSEKNIQVTASRHF